VVVQCLGLVGLYCGLWTAASVTVQWRQVVRDLNDLPAQSGFSLTKKNLPLHAALIQYLSVTDHSYQVCL
jgi:hypothetical protein